MPRTHNRKTDRGQYSFDFVRKAVLMVKSGEGLRKVAKQIGMDKTTLSRYVKKVEISEENLHMIGFWGNRRVFSLQQELILCDYLIRSCKMYYGLTAVEMRKLAYQLAVRNKNDIPNNWHSGQIAGKDWFNGFLKRNKQISIRKPEATSMGRASCFNKTNVIAFFRNLENVKARHNFLPNNIYNVDETGCTTVQETVKVLSPKGQKQVGAITGSEDRGKLVTVCCCVNAIGQAIPPMFIFPRVHFKSHFIKFGPAGCIGTSYPSGWMTAESFLMFMKHFVQHVSF